METYLTITGMVLLLASFAAMVAEVLPWFGQ